MFCPKCGTQNNDNLKFCANCGEPLNANPQQQPPQQPQYQQPYQQPQYQQPVYQQPYQMPVIPGKGMGIASMVLGIVSLALFCFWYISIPCSIVAAALGGVAFNKAKTAGVKNGVATAGIAMACVALGLALLFVLLGVIGLAEIGAFS